MTHSYESHDSFISAPCQIHMRAMTRSYERCNFSIFVPCLIHMHAVTPFDASQLIFVFRIHMRAMIHSYESHDSFI